MDSSTRSVDDSVFLHVRRIDFFTGPSQLTLECDSGASGNVKFWRELNGLTEQVTVTGDVSVHVRVCVCLKLPYFLHKHQMKATKNSQAYAVGTHGRV